MDFGWGSLPKNAERNYKNTRRMCIIILYNH